MTLDTLSKNAFLPQIANEELWKLLGYPSLQAWQDAGSPSTPPASTKPAAFTAPGLAPAAPVPPPAYSEPAGPPAPPAPTFASEAAAAPSGGPAVAPGATTQVAAPPAPNVTGPAQATSSAVASMPPAGLSTPQPQQIKPPSLPGAGLASSFDQANILPVNTLPTDNQNRQLAQTQSVDSLTASLPPDVKRNLIDTYNNEVANGASPGTAYQHLYNTVMDTLQGNAKPVGPLAQPLDFSSPKAAFGTTLGVTTGLQQMAGEGLSTIARPATQALNSVPVVGGTLASTSDQALRLAPYFINPAAGLEGLSGAGKQLAAAVLGGELGGAATNQLGLGRGIGQNIGQIVAPVAAPAAEGGIKNIASRIMGETPPPAGTKTYFHVTSPEDAANIQAKGFNKGAFVTDASGLDTAVQKIIDKGQTPTIVRFDVPDSSLRPSPANAHVFTTTEKLTPSSVTPYEAAAPVGAAASITPAAQAAESTIPGLAESAAMTPAPSPVSTLPPGGNIRPPAPPGEPPGGGSFLPSNGGETAVTKLVTAVNESRQLPAMTEELRSAERSRRVAIANSQLEQGGWTPEAYNKARAALGGEMPKTSYEPPKVQFTPSEILDLRSKLPVSGLPTLSEMNAEAALNKVLDGRYADLRPFEINLLDQVYGPKLSAALTQKQLVANGLLPRLRDGLYEYWLSNVLSGPVTQMRQFTGNLSSAVASVPERLAAAGLEQPLAHLQGRPVQRFWEEAPAQAIGMFRGIPEGVRGALNVIKNGFAPSDVSRIEQGGTTAIPGLLGRIVRGPLTIFEAGDALFKGINQEGNMTALAVRQARQEGLKGAAIGDRVAQILANPSDSLIEKALGETAYRLFRDEPTRYGQAILNARNDIPMMKFIVPFVRTPDRLVAFGIRRSPLGLFDVPMWQRLAAGNPQAVDELGQTLIGSTVAAGVATLIATGQLDITAGLPTNAAARDRFYREGKQPFAVKMPGIGWVQYNQIPVLNETLTNVAAAVDAIKAGKDPAAAVTQTAATIGQNLLDQSYLSGLSDFLSAVSDPVNQGEKFLQRQVTGFVPLSGALRQSAQIADRTVRQPQGMLQTIEAGIPGLEQNVPARLTAFGQPAQRATPSPVTISPDQTSAVDAELGRLGVEVGFVGTTLGGVKLSTEQQNEYQQLAGQRTYQALSQLIQMPLYDKLSDTLKEKALHNAIDQARSDARDVMNLRLAKQKLQSLGAK